jgi:hypothetical protein
MENGSPSLTIEAKVMRSISGDFYGSAILRGCSLLRTNESRNVISNRRYDFCLTGSGLKSLILWTSPLLFH